MTGSGNTYTLVKQTGRPPKGSSFIISVYITHLKTSNTFPGQSFIWTDGTAICQSSSGNEKFPSSCSSSSHLQILYDLVLINQELLDFFRCGLWVASHCHQSFRFLWKEKPPSRTLRHRHCCHSSGVTYSLTFVSNYLRPTQDFAPTLCLSPKDGLDGM